ncbi:cell surface glycoprotein MUC18-like isoform X5 [Sinocyclocheilus anshuiensis]|uniref:cell surface glycoprotein MUC18-like isoform X5 n=1 Tax=Sinocyclocheilus anshuiensis TaxID=1608454 RepID=UPI0007BAA3D4|nr:PREDICTED: cell surface glycoprotein MUC18-like isoform X5 [Sinocyclocheilus anshuiensis]
MTLRYIALLIAGLSVLTCKTWAVVDVSMEDRVDVFLKGQAEIPCIYTLKEPAKMIVWFTKLPGRDQSRRRIYYYDDQNEIIEEGSEYAGRIKVTHSHEPQNARGSAILIIDNVQLSDQRDFICTVLNVSTDSGEGHTHLQIFNSPSLPMIEGMHTGISVTVEEPSKVAHCKVDDGYPRPNITWYKDRFPLQQSDGEVKTMESVTTKPNGLLTVDSELYIKVKRTYEDALFYCEVKYFVPGGVRMTESKKINITVYYPTTEVTMSVNPPDRLIKEGDTVEILCEGNGKPQPFFDFTHNGNELSSNEEMLLLENVKRSSSGTYVCQSIDFDTNTVTEDSINMTVHYLDHIVVTPEETVLDQGEDLTLTCNALSSLPTQTAWYKDGMRLVERHVLELNNASYDTAGMYMCEVTVPSLPELREQKSVQISVRVSRVTTTTTQATSTKGTGLIIPPKQPRTGGGSGVIIAVIIICLLLIAILGSVLYFLYKKGKLPCGRSGKQDFTKEKASKDDIVMEMKSGKSEEAVLLQVNGDKKSPTE